MRTSAYNPAQWKRTFFTIWSGQAASLFGGRLVDFALVWYMTTQTGSAVVLTTAALVGMLPTIFISPILGTLVDGPIMAIIQSRVAPELQGRVLHFLISTGRVAAPAGLLLSGLMTEAFGISVWFFIAGFGWLAIILVGLGLPAIMTIEDRPAETGPAAEISAGDESAGKQAIPHG